MYKKWYFGNKKNKKIKQQQDGCVGQITDQHQK